MHIDLASRSCGFQSTSTLSRMLLSHCESAMPAVRANGVALEPSESRGEQGADESGWSWSDARGGTAWIEVPAGAQSVSVTLPSGT